ncbi:MAG: hypothetical protein Q9210_004697 [Variospora velana]
MSLTKTLIATFSRSAASTLRRQAPSAFRSSTRLLCTSPILRAKDSKMSTGPPKHEMQYFPNMVNAMPSESAEFRRVLWTGLYSQVVLMTVPVGGDIGDEVHTVDQALTFTSGVGKATINGKDQDVKAGDLMVVPAGTQHQFVNTGPTPLILYTIYSPAEHDPRTVHKTKEEGDEEEEAGKDEAPKWSRQSQSENEKAGLVNTSGKY